jgi:hypothetical protein
MADFYKSSFVYGFIGLAVIGAAAYGSIAVVTANVGSKDSTIKFGDVIAQIMAVNFALMLGIFLLSVWFTYNNQVNERLYLIAMTSLNFFIATTAVSISALVKA